MVCSLGAGGGTAAGGRERCIDPLAFDAFEIIPSVIPDPWLMPARCFSSFWMGHHRPARGSIPVLRVTPAITGRRMYPLCGHLCIGSEPHEAPGLGQARAVMLITALSLLTSGSARVRLRASRHCRLEKIHAVRPGNMQPPRWPRAKVPGWPASLRMEIAGRCL